MNDDILADLAQRLAADEEAGFQHFRQLFFEALERRRLADCRALLAVLCADRSPRLQRDCLYHQAVLYFELRQFDQAEVILSRLLADDLSPVQRARTLLELAIQLDLQGQWLEAEHFYQEALTAYEATGDKSGKARTYNNLGVSIRFQVEQGNSDPARLKEALACHRAALVLAQAANDQTEFARIWHGLGMVYGLMGQYSLAQAAFQKNLDLWRALNGTWNQGISLSDLATLVYQPQGQFMEAAAALDQAIAIFRAYDDDFHLAEALTRRGNLLAQQNRLVEALASYDEALARVESIRAQLTTPTAQAGYRATAEFVYAAPLSLHLQHGEAAHAFTAAERARSRVLADLLAGQAVHAHTTLPTHLLQERLTLRQTLDEAYAQEARPADLDHLERVLADIDRQIELLDPTYAALERVTALTAEAVSEQLSSDAVLLTYTGDADDHLWVLTVTTSGVQAELIKNVSAGWLRDYLVKQLHGAWQGSLIPNPQTGRLSAPNLFPSLFRALIAPVWDTLQAAQTVYIVPFGSLHYLPLGALTPDLTSPPPLLAEGRRVVYAPSATILLNYCHTRSPSPYRGLLAIAPSDDRLQFTLGAAERITRQVGSATLTGSAATHQAMLDRAGQYRVVCFLGHAYFDQRYPMSSRLQLVDGSLRASEILRELRLQADLVILSACETGRSQVLRGDEILGLSRAMLYAGTPSLLVTLWPVHEIPTRLLVEKFVEQLTAAAHFDPALVLAAMQRWLAALTCEEAHALMANWDNLSEPEARSHLTRLWQLTHPGETPQAQDRVFAHPFFWSPYILIGDQL